MDNSAIQNIFISRYRDGIAGVSVDQRNAIRDIMDCRTEKLGGVKTVCRDCGSEFFHYRSCGNRNCPKCQAVKQIRWEDARKSEIVDTTYYHAVFTVPAELNSVFLMYTNQCCNLLFKAVSDTLLTMAADPKHLNAKIGFFCELQTWGSTMEYHPHVHVIILGCGLDKLGKIVFPKGQFLFPVRAVSKLFRGKFLDGLKKLNLPCQTDFGKLYSKDWVVYIKGSANGADNVIKYLARYVNRIAISNQRIVSYDSEAVTFNYKDYRDNCKIKSMTLSVGEFTRRFIMHVLPKGFTKVRFYGLLASRNKARCLKILRYLLHSAVHESRFKGKTSSEIVSTLFGDRYCSCPSCGSKNITRVPLPPKTG